MVNFHLPNPQTPLAITHAAVGSVDGWAIVALLSGLFILPAIILIGQELILQLIGWWEVRHGDQS